MAETEDGENGLATGIIRRPIPDPTVLTSLQSRAVEERAIAREQSLKELLLTHIKGLTEQISFQFQAAKEAVGKSEVSTVKLLDQLQTILSTVTGATNERIAMLERRLTLIEGRSIGTEKGEDKQRDDSARYIGMAGLIVAVIAVVAMLIHPPASPIPPAPVITIPPVVAHGGS